MPTANELDPEIPNIFIRQALTAPSAAWKASAGQGGGWTDADWNDAVTAAGVITATCGNRVTTQEGVSRPPVFPYVKWHLRADASGLVTFNARRQVSGRERVVAVVRRLDCFPSGSGSYNQARGVALAIRTCLLGAAYTPIFGTSGRIGCVVSTELLDAHRSSYYSPDSNDLITELGIIVAITYES